MKLQDLLAIIKEGAPVRLFVGCMKTFDGTKPNASESNKQWNKKVSPYMDCEVIGVHARDNTIIIVI